MPATERGSRRESDLMKINKIAKICKIGCRPVASLSCSRWYAIATVRPARPPVP